MQALRRSSLLAVPLALFAVPASAQQGKVVPIGGQSFVDAQAIVQTATGLAFTGMLGVCVDNAGHYYVSSRRDLTTNPHALFEFDANGAYVATYNQPAGTATSAWGVRDMALDDVNNVIYGGLEGDVIYAFDATAGIWDQSLDITVTGASTGGVIRALALDSASGTFYTASFESVMQTIDKATGAASPMTLPSVTTGAYGMGLRRQGGAVVGLMIHSQSRSRTGPGAPGKELNMVEVDPLTGAETGNYFYGDYAVAGVAGGAEMHTIGGEQVLVCLAQGDTSDGFYAQRVVDVYGTGCGGDIDYSGGNPYSGNPAFTVDSTNLVDPAVFLLTSWGEMTTSLPGVTACSVLVNFPVLTATPGTVLAGTASWTVPIPPGLPVPGTVYFQVVTVGAGLPVNLTNALKLAIQP